MEEALGLALRWMVGAASVTGTDMGTLWPQMVHVTYIKSVLSLAVQFILAASLGGVTYGVKRYCDGVDEYHSENKDSAWGIVAIFWAIVAFVLMAAFLDAVVGLTNPEYRTIVDLIDKAKTMVR